MDNNRHRQPHADTDTEILSQTDTHKYSHKHILSHMFSHMSGDMRPSVSNLYVLRPYELIETCTEKMEVIKSCRDWAKICHDGSRIVTTGGCMRPSM